MGLYVSVSVSDLIEYGGMSSDMLSMGYRSEQKKKQNKESESNKRTCRHSYATELVRKEQ